VDDQIEVIDPPLPDRNNFTANALVMYGREHIVYAVNTMGELFDEKNRHLNAVRALNEDPRYNDITDDQVLSEKTDQFARLVNEHKQSVFRLFENYASDTQGYRSQTQLDRKKEQLAKKENRLEYYELLLTGLISFVAISQIFVLSSVDDENEGKWGTYLGYAAGGIGRLGTMVIGKLKIDTRSLKSNIQSLESDNGINSEQTLR